MLGHKQRYRGYADYIHEGVDPDLLQFYHHGNTATVIGDKEFRSWLHDDVLPDSRAEDKAKITHADRNMAQVTRAVAKFYKKDSKSIRSVIKGPDRLDEIIKVL